METTWKVVVLALVLQLANSAVIIPRGNTENTTEIAQTPKNPDLEREAKDSRLGNLINLPGASLHPENPIAFHVQKTEHFIAGGAFVTVPFERELLNLGGGWSSIANQFLAPVRGVYYFSVHAYATAERACWVWLTHNTNRVQKVDAPGGQWLSASATIILQVEQFDLIYLQLEGGHAFRGDGLSHFSGFLLHPL